MDRARPSEGGRPAQAVQRDLIEIPALHPHRRHCLAMTMGRWRVELTRTTPVAIAGYELDALHTPFGDGHDHPLHLLVK
jgi:hypothetical protein